MKLLDGRELAGFVKERQARLVRSLNSNRIFPKLVIVRDSDNPVILKYVSLKQKYGEDIGVEVEDIFAKTEPELKAAIEAANKDKSVSGIIVQLPLENPEKTEEITSLITEEKDVDGLAHETFDSATAEAINWLLAGHNIELKNHQIALVGRGKLVGKPLEQMWRASGLNPTIFHHGSDFSELKNFDLIVTATGSPRLIKSEMVKPGAVIVDAGTASENGVLLGDIDEKVRERQDLAAITPKIGGVGPLTISVLFDHVIQACPPSS